MKNMQFYSQAEMVKTEEQGVVLTIGNFDGVHRGHQALLQLLVDLAHREKALAGVLTFDPHPSEILRPEKPHVRLLTSRDQQFQLQKMGIDFLIEEKFTPELSKMSAEDFFDKKILPLRPRHLVIGHDFSLGAQRRGNHEFLQQRCQQNQIQLHLVHAQLDQGKPISSTRIREALREGDLQTASRLLGRPFEISGTVVSGAQKGRSLGAPTANLVIQKPLALRHGVYVTSLWLQDQHYSAISNFGVRPTMEGSDQKQILAETHLLHEQLNLYNQVIRVQFYQYLRDEKKFASIEDLKTQIQKDISSAKAWHESN